MPPTLHAERCVDGGEKKQKTACYVVVVEKCCCVKKKCFESTTYMSRTCRSISVEELRYGCCFRSFLPPCVSCSTIMYNPRSNRTVDRDLINAHACGSTWYGRRETKNLKRYFVFRVPSPRR